MSFCNQYNKNVKIIPLRLFLNEAFGMAANITMNAKFYRISNMMTVLMKQKNIPGIGQAHIMSNCDLGSGTANDHE